MSLKPSLKRRASGLLLHLSCLPGGHGIGDLGPEAHRFAEFLRAAGQGWWQMLPMGPAGAGNSPYSSPSSFAGNPLFISLDRLAQEELLAREELEAAGELPAGRADYDAVRRFKEPRLRKAFERFSKEGRPDLWAALTAFHAAHAGWLDDYALYCALKERYPGKSWTQWHPEVRAREFRKWGREALRELGEAAAYHIFLQFVFQAQWGELREHIAKLGVGLIGDVPLFVAQESADVWANPGIFQLDAEGRPTVVAGVPPDYFSQTGQLWGNPLYRWGALKERGYDWWLMRLKQAAERFEAVRLDHFIGFAKCWEIPAGAQTAQEGHWAPGPGADFFDRITEGIRDMELIAEDLGSVTADVVALRERAGLPGMRVLQFAFGSDDQAESFLPHNYPWRCVAYTGTHDNDTTAGWFAQAGKERDRALRYLGSDGREIHWDMVRAVMRSGANTAIFPVQDILGLGSACRMNRPGTEKGNWGWRLEPGALSLGIADRLRRLAQESGRV